MSDICIHFAARVVYAIPDCQRLTSMSHVALGCRIFPILPFAICHLKSQLLDPITPRAFVRHKFLAQENKVIRTEGGGLNHGGQSFYEHAMHILIK